MKSISSYKLSLERNGYKVEMEIIGELFEEGWELILKDMKVLIDNQNDIGKK